MSKVEKLSFWSLVLIAVVVLGSDFYRIIVMKQCVYTCQSKGASHE